MQHARPNRLRRAVAYAALAALLGVVTLVLSQCMMVGDNVTGISLDRNARVGCLKNCQTVHQACLDEAAHNCGGINNACYAAAEALCDGAFQECKNNCHKQGGGSAG